MIQRMPALFLGHGSPMNAIADSPERRAWVALGNALPRPASILVVSAHWENRGAIHLTTGDSPRTIHDFSGFDPALHEVQYPAPGAPDLVERVAQLLGEAQVHRDDSWGFDHGSWGVLHPMLPKADVPMIQLGLNRSLSTHQHLAVAAALAPLREEGVLIVSSGNIVHNLPEYFKTMGTRPEWAVEFQDRITAAVQVGDHAALTNFAPDDRAAALAINSGEHYLPLLYTVGARLPGDEVGVFNHSIDGAMSMTSYLIGDIGLLKTLH